MAHRGRKKDVSIYSESLKQFCRENDYVLESLKGHAENIQRIKDIEELLSQAKDENAEKPSGNATHHRNLSVMFSTLEDDGSGHLPSRRTGTEDSDEAEAEGQADNPFCYLCSTMAEHRAHLKTEKKIRGKPRIPYTAPAPFVPPKPLPPKPQPAERLYKVTVKTGLHAEAKNSAPVLISLAGSGGKLKRAPLTKKFGSLGFFFNSDSTESFHLRGPNLGRISQMTLQLDATNMPDAQWLVESVTIKDYAGGEEYFFKINKWITSVGRTRKAKMAPTTIAKSLGSGGRGVIVTTFTGKKATSGTDSRVHISFMGSLGLKGKYELKPEEDSQAPFSPGAKDVFELSAEDFGELKGIRLELDGVRRQPKDSARKKSQPKSPSWFVEQVIVKDMKSNKKWLFAVSDWLTEDSPIKEVWTVKDLQDDIGIVSGAETRYRIVTKTGSKSFAGTDSTVYLSLFDANGRRADFALKDEDKSKFEKGQTDEFLEVAKVIGAPQRLKVSISGTGVAPDWYMDEIVITKYYLMEEILQHLQRMQFANKMPDGLKAEKGKIIFEAQDQKEKNKGKKKKDEPQESSDEDAEVFGKQRRKKPQRQTLKEDETSDSSVESHDDHDPGRGEVKLPYAERVTFQPRSKDDSWLKKNKTVELKLKPGGSKILYKTLKLRNDNSGFEEARKRMIEWQQKNKEEKEKPKSKVRKSASLPKYSKNSSDQLPPPPPRAKTPTKAKRDESDSESSSSSDTRQKRGLRKQPAKDLKPKDAPAKGSRTRDASAMESKSTTKDSSRKAAEVKPSTAKGARAREPAPKEASSKVESSKREAAVPRRPASKKKPSSSSSSSSSSDSSDDGKATKTKAGEKSSQGGRLQKPSAKSPRPAEVTSKLGDKSTRATDRRRQPPAPGTREDSESRTALPTDDVNSRMTRRRGSGDTERSGPPMYKESEDSVSKLRRPSPRVAAQKDEVKPSPRLSRLERGGDADGESLGASRDSRSPRVSRLGKSDATTTGRMSGSRSPDLSKDSATFDRDDQPRQRSERRGVGSEATDFRSQRERRLASEEQVGERAMSQRVDEDDSFSLARYRRQNRSSPREFKDNDRGDEAPVRGRVAAAEDNDLSRGSSYSRLSRGSRPTRPDASGPLDDSPPDELSLSSRYRRPRRDASPEASGDSSSLRFSRSRREAAVDPKPRILVTPDDTDAAPRSFNRSGPTSPRRHPPPPRGRQLGYNID